MPSPSPLPHQANRRMPLSCEPCRERKIRCPRRASQGRGPCETCVRRGIPPSECVYLRDLYSRRRNGPVSRHGPNAPTELAASSNAELIERIRRLEQMVQAHVQGGTEATSASQNLPSPDSVLLPRSSAGFDRPESRQTTILSEEPEFSSHHSQERLVHSKSGHIRYVPSSFRVSSGLQGLSSMHHLGSDLDDYTDHHEAPFSIVSSNRDDLLALLPPQSQCNKLKDIYFGVFAPLLHILHDPTFDAEYNSFCDDPNSVSFSWLALLYAVFSVAVIAVPDTDRSLLGDLGHRKTTAENMSILFQKYRRAAMLCLEADNYLWKHNLNTLQTLVLLIYGINHTHGQSWALLGTARNIAFAIGCHVDPDAFDLGIVAAEERRRAWAGLNLLYTVQNTTMGHLDTSRNPGGTKLPLDVNDDQLSETAESPPMSQSQPSQMSYLIIKFQLYETCSTICKTQFDNGSQLCYDTIRELDSEISSKQESLNCKYLIDTTHTPLADYHAVHLNVLFGYTHQLMLLLHRPILMWGANPQYGALRLTRDEWLHSRDRCVESSRALLGIHRILHEDEIYRPYSWYNRGLGSFHAFHGVICLAYILANGDGLDADSRQAITRDIESALTIFEQISQTGLSAVCKRAIPVIRKVLVICEGLLCSSDASAQSSHTRVPQSPDSNAIDSFNVTLASNVSAADFQALVGSLGDQPWLSPSSINWFEWEAAMDLGRMETVF